MKRTGFKRLTYEEALKKQEEARERARRKKRLPKPAGTEKVRPKAERIPTLKRSLWVAFSRYIRRKYADKNGMVLTCDGVMKHWKDTHCGHLFNNSERNQSLGGNELWYYENNFAPQSANGNYFNAEDSSKKYMLWAVKRYGQDEVDKMFRMKHTARKWTEEELTALLVHYRQEFSKMEAS